MVVQDGGAGAPPVQAGGCRAVVPGNEQGRLTSAMQQSSENLMRLKVVVFQISACSAIMHKDLAGLSVKLKFVVNGRTHLKSNAGKPSIDIDQQLGINFDSMAGSAIYEGGEMLNFELYRAGLFRSSQMLASCAVPAMTVLQSIFEPRQELNLELIGSDTPDKVLANLTVQIGFRFATLGHVGGFQVLKTPSLKLPANPNPAPSCNIRESHEAIVGFCKKANEVAKHLTKVHGASMMAIASCSHDALLLKDPDTAEAKSMIARASRPCNALRSSTPDMAESDGMSTACDFFSAEESLSEWCSTTVCIQESSTPQSIQAIKSSLQRHCLQCFQFDELANCVSNESGGVSALQFSVSRKPDDPHSKEQHLSP